MTVLILGAGTMQAPAIRIAKNNGWKVICADGNPEAPLANDVHKFLHIDLKDREGLVEAAKDIKNNEGLDGVFTAGTDFSSSVAWVAEKLELPGISYESALNATDKIRMRSCFKESGVPSPQFRELSSEMEYLKELDGMNYPLVVKPVDNMGARGVRKIRTAEEVDDSVNKAIAFSRTGRAIVEEFLTGEEYSIDSLVYQGDVTIHGLAIRHIYYPPYFIEMGHTMPAVLSDEKKQEIERVFKQGVKALGIDNGAAKGDVFYTKSGPVIGEIAARLSGGYMSGWTFPYASGVEATEGALKIALGLEPDEYDGSYKAVTAERAFLSIPGTISCISYLDEAHDAENVRDLFLRVDEGEKVQFPVNNVEKCGNVIAVHEERSTAMKSAEKACAKIIVRLNREDDETGAFLFEEKDWPSDAFTLTNSHTLEAYENLSSISDFQWKNISFVDFKPVPLPEMAYEISLDWQGRTLSEVYNRILEETGLEECSGGDFDESQAFFWRSIVKGSIQGGLWFYDRYCL